MNRTMPEFSPQQLQEWSGGSWCGPPAGTVRAFAFDSRRIREGDLFVCLRSEQRDGHDFMGDAAASGAAGALVARYRPEAELPQLVVDDPLRALQAMAAAHRRTFARPVVGISGSCGKTSTKDLLALLLGGRGKIHATEGNFNNLIGVPITLLQLDPERHGAAVIEAGINFQGEMAQLAGMIQPSHAIITLIAAAHLEKLHDLPTVAREKAVLPQAVPDSSQVVFPASCLQYEAFSRLSPAAIVVAEEGEQAEAAVRFSVAQEEQATVLQMRTSEGKASFTLRKTSHGMAANAALAITLARALGVGDEAIRERLAQWAPARFRGQIVERGRARLYVDCYNANPSAMEDSLAFFKEISADAPARLYVLGCMGELGDESARHHRELGRKLRLGARDRVFITGSDAEALREGLLAAGNKPEQVSLFGRIEEVEEEVARHEGFIFLKGSRAYGLEALVERTAAADGKGASC